MVCENTSSGLGQKVGQGYYDGGSVSQVVSMKLCMEWTNRSAESTSSKRGGHAT